MIDGPTLTNEGPRVIGWTIIIVFMAGVGLGAFLTN